MNRIRFNDLPPPVRERFVQIARAPGMDPRVITYHKQGSGIWAAYVFGVLAVFGLVWCLFTTFTRGQRFEPYYDRQLYYMLGGAIAVILVSFTAIIFRMFWKPPPYGEGMYVFRSYLVKTRGGELTLMPLTNIGVPRIVTMRRNGAYVGTRLELGGPFTIHHNSDAKAQSHWETIATARAHFRTMMANRDGAGLANIDPFVECTTSGNWQFPQQMLGAGPLADTRPSWLGFAQWGVAAVIGLGVAGVYYLAIDTIFDEDRTAYEKRFSSPPPAATSPRPRSTRH